MRKENCMYLLFAGVAPLFFMGHSVASAADTVVVIPLFTTATTCTAPDEVKSAGHCWKNRNLGASRVATISGDTFAFGDYYQWGRPRDGHQNFNSATTTNNISENDVPGHSAFIITTPSSPNDWRNPRNDNLWQGLGGVNNPCPQGFRLPTKSELVAEIASWGVNNNAVGAFESPLHLVVAGSRKYNTGEYINGSKGCYWSSTTYHTSTSHYMYFSDNAVTNVSRRADGMSVRCIKD